MSKDYIPRKIDAALREWGASPHRKPLLLRGARQVGKTASVREFGRGFDFFVEVNFDEKKNVHALFNRDLSPSEICDELSLLYNTPVIAGRTLLFFDEIQACPAALSALRYFYERLPALHLVAAGSLLEFALQSLPSFAVGRVRSLFLFPLAFDEYLRAAEGGLLAEAVTQASPEKPLSDAVHKKCIQHLLRFILVGGMPEVVATATQGGSLLDCQRVLDDLLLSLFDDFAKYKARVPALRLREVFASVMNQTGKKFVYSHASQTGGHAQIKEAVDLLEMAGVVFPVTHAGGNGIPLAAEQKLKFRKELVFDTGVLQRFLKLDFADYWGAETLEQMNKGALAELFVGLELLKAGAPDSPAQLHYWHREERGATAEVDYLIERGGCVIPLDVKSGTQGAMQSIWRFLAEKPGSPYGIRCSLETFATLSSGIKPLEVYPLYAVGNLFAKSRVEFA